jgi:hypothetical protein
MRILHRYKFVFLAHPRTASRSVRSVLDPYSDVSSVHISETSPSSPFYHHIPAKEIVPHFDRLGWKLGDYFWFAVARSPFTRVPSLYRWYQAHCDNECSFENFVFERLNTEHPMYSSAISFGRAADGEQIVNRYLRYETLGKDLREVLRTLSIHDDICPETI